MIVILALACVCLLASMLVATKMVGDVSRATTPVTPIVVTGVAPLLDVVPMS